MYTVSSGTACVLKAETAEQSVCLNDIFERFRNDVLFHRHECALTVCHEYIITFARNSHACAAAAITLADEIHTFGLCVCFGFKICGQCVADSGREQARGGVCEYLRIYKHKFRRSAHLLGANMYAVIGVQNGYAGSRCVGRSGGRHDYARPIKLA